MYDPFHTIGIIAPAGKLKPDKFDTGVAFLRAAGKQLKFGSHVNGPSPVAYLAAGDAVYATIPVGYCAGGEISVSMYDGGTLTYEIAVMPDVSGRNGNGILSFENRTVSGTTKRSNYLILK